VVALLGGAAAGYVLYVRHEGRDIRGSAAVEFTTTAATTTTTTTIAAPPVRRPATRHRPRQDETVAWSTYGFDAARLRVAPSSGLLPPFRTLWVFHGQALLEFPPAVAYGRVYLPTFDGRFYALDSRTGKPVWRYRSGRCAWDSPAVDRHLVFETFIGHACDSRDPGSDGEVVAFDAASGRVRWHRVIGPTESSPLVANGLLYVGDWLGRIYALSEATGRTVWTFTSGGQVKGSLALAGGRLYVGAYDGRLYALDARTGREAWSASGQPRLGGGGTFYSTPAVAFGRVYIGSTDGKVYSFGARSGKLRWSHSTGGYVYASPAIWRRYVLVGSYDHRFYAFDAATGAVRWQFAANGPISGSATVLDGNVYFSTFARRTYALDAATGRPVWTWPDGEYSPLVSDSQRIYLTGLGRLYAMVERHAAARPPRARR
jgi:outer membrane protein assembly factor BamB